MHRRRFQFATLRPWRAPALAVGLAVGTVVSGAVSAQPGEGEAAIGQFFSRFCLECHDSETRKGEVDLTPAALTSVNDDPGFWQDVFEQIESGEMPPEDPLPAVEERDAALNAIGARLDSVDWERFRRPGVVPTARLTKAEYRNTLRDLLGIDLHAGERLPIDGEGASGFSNDRQALSLTAAQVDRYFDEAERLIAAVLALADEPRRQRFAALEMARAAGHRKLFEEGAMLVHPGDQVQAAHQFPVDGYYRFEINARNFGQPSVVEVAVDGQVVAATEVTAPRHETVVATGFVRAGAATVTMQARNLVPQTPLPPDVSQRVQAAAEARAAKLPPLSDDEGDLVRQRREALNTRSVALQEAYEWLRVLGPGADSREIDRFRKYALERDAGSEPARDRLAAELGLDRAAFDALWRERNAAVIEDQRRLLDAVADVEWGDWQRYQGKIVADWLEIVGPVEDGGAPLVRLADPNTGELSARFVERAFRRPVSAGEVGRYEDLRREAIQGGASKREALQLAATAVLVSPKFLLRESVPESTPDAAVPDPGEPFAPIDGFTLASRLSYFLWQSMPDAALFELARSGRLGEPEVLTDQIDRMLSDDRADAFYGSFVEQWLGLAVLDQGSGPDRTRYPEFTPDLAAAMEREAVLWFRHVVCEDLDLLRLIDSDESFLNATLADHYGIDGFAGSSFERVELTDPRRGGLLGMAAVLTATSTPTREHPSRRGTWVLETLLGRELGEPLADAGELPADAGQQRGLTLREELDLHRNRPACASCHDLIDPVGLGLQGFDAIGRWRDNEAGEPIDDSGRLPDGAVFDGPEGLRAALVERRGDVVRQLCAELLAYAVGREVERFDRSEIDRMVARVEAKGGSARAWIAAVVDSLPFRYVELE